MPYFNMACFAYSEHDGTNLHLDGKNGEMHF